MLIEKIKADQLAARKTSQSVAASLLTTLIGEASTVAKNARRDLPTDEEVSAVVKKFLKNNAEMQAAILKGEMTPLKVEQLNVAKYEQDILERYQPKQLSEDELKQIITDAISAGTPATMPGLMGFLKSNYAGQYDGKLASAVVKAAAA